jgi:MscS family membrane protein
MVFFDTTSYAEDLKAKEDLLLNVLKLAEALEVHIAFPSTSVYIESMPERKGQMPDYGTENLEQSNQNYLNFLSELPKDKS